MNFYSVGYVADLAALLAKRIGFEYKLVLVPDNKYGRMNKITGKWDGIMKELVEGVSMLSDAFCVGLMLWCLTPLSTILM
jgi:hypothetical protein